MKRLFLLVLFGFSLSQLQAEEAVGTLTLEKEKTEIKKAGATLTLEKEKVVFRSKGIKESYDVMEIPGFKVIDFVPKGVVKDRQETDVSELLLELPTGGKITLVTSKPVGVVRIISGSSAEWKLKEK